MKKLQRHWSTIAWDKFRKDNADLFNLSNIGTDPRYLENRICRGFMAGIDAQAIEFAKPRRTGRGKKS